MIYKAGLQKGRTCFWDEDTYARFLFWAESDEDAKTFLATVVLRINRAYKKIGQPRNVAACQLVGFVSDYTKPYQLIEQKVDLSTPIYPAKGVANIRAILNAFYPKEGDGRRCLAHMFTEFKPIKFQGLGSN